MRKPRGPSSRDITDLQVCEAYRRYNEQVDASVLGEAERWPHEILCEMTGATEARAIRAIERAGQKGLISSMIRLRVARLTPSGYEILENGG